MKRATDEEILKQEETDKLGEFKIPATNCEQVTKMRRHKRIKMKPPWLKITFIQTNRTRATSSELKRQTIFALAAFMFVFILQTPIDTHCDSARIADTSTKLSAKLVGPLSGYESKSEEANSNAADGVASAPMIVGNRVDSDGAEEANGEHEPDKSSSEASSLAPRFAQSHDSTVIASIYQNEVYLPCKILNLDEDQTVSCEQQSSNLLLERRWISICLLS